MQIFKAKLFEILIERKEYEKVDYALDLPEGQRNAVQQNDHEVIRAQEGIDRAHYHEYVLTNRHQAHDKAHDARLRLRTQDLTLFGTGRIRSQLDKFFFLSGVFSC